MATVSYGHDGVLFATFRVFVLFILERNDNRLFTPLILSPNRINTNVRIFVPK